MPDPINPWCCIACSKDIEPSARFCSECGAEQLSETDGDVFTSRPAGPPDTSSRSTAGRAGLIARVRTDWRRSAAAGLGALALVGGGLLFLNRSSAAPVAVPSTTTSAVASATTATTGPGGVISRASGHAVGLRSDGTLVRVDLATGASNPLQETLAAETRWQSLHSNGTDVIAMSQGSVSVIPLSGVDERAEVGTGDRVIASPGGRWIVTEEVEPSESAPLAWRRGQPEATPLTLAPGMAVVGIAGDDVVISGGGSIFLLNPSSGQSRFVATGIPIATANDVLVRSVCASPTSCQMRWGPWEEPNRNIRPLPDQFRGVWGFPGSGVLSPDRSKVAALDSTYDAQQVRVIDLEQGTESSYPTGRLIGRFPSLSFSEDGRNVVHVSRERVEGATGRIVIRPLDGSPPTSIDLGDVVSVTAGLARLSP